MKNILVPTDFSGSSVNAALCAAQLTPKLKPAKIILLHCFAPAIIASEIPYAAPYYAGDLKESSIQQLNDLKNKLLPYADPAATLIEIIASDEPIIQTVKTLIEIQNVEMVIIGSTEKGTLEKILVGSYTLDIIKSSRVPVLVVPQQKLPLSVRNIAFAVDLKNYTRVPVNSIKSIVSAFNAKLFIVNVAADGEFGPDAILAQENLHRHWNSENAEYHYITNKDIAEGIKEFISEYQIDLLILVPQHRDFFESLFHNSITKEFSFDNDIPVMFINEE